MYTGAKTVVRTVYGNSNGFEVKVGMHQGSALNPLLFVIVMEALSREIRVALPWELLYADDLVVIAETEDDLIKRFNKWKDFVENRGLRVNMNKTTIPVFYKGDEISHLSHLIFDILILGFASTFGLFIYFRYKI